MNRQATGVIIWDCEAGKETDMASTSRRWWTWVALAAPYVALLWVPFYNDRAPTIAGFPFFYWYQFACVPLTSLLLYLVYRSAR
jgi:hypothetical protein